MKKKTTRTKNLKEVLGLIRVNLKTLRKMKVKYIAVFGSFARNEQTQKSDVDLLIDFSEPIGFFKYYDIKIFLEDILGRKVDLVIKDSLRPEFQEQVERELILAA